MSRITMERKICLEPRLLDDKITDHLFNKIKTELLGHCDQKYGYIIKIYNNIEVLENIISSASPGVFFNIRFSAKVIKPEIGGEYEGKVCMLFNEGIFVELFERIKVLVPSDKMNGYKFIKTSGNFKKGNDTISKGDIVTIKITLFKYEKQNFSCIGSLKSK